MYVGIVFAALAAVHRLTNGQDYHVRGILVDTWRAIKIALLFWCSGGIVGLVILWSPEQFYAYNSPPVGMNELREAAWCAGSAGGLAFGCVAAGLLTIHRTYRATD
jgi:hypothetical protein